SYPPGKERCVGDRQVLDAGVEEPARRRGHTIRAPAKVDLVEVEIQDVVLGELRLEAECQNELLQLPLVAPLRREQERLHDLLRDRAASLHDLMVQDVGDQSAQDAERIDAVMAIELRILGGEEGEAHVTWDGLERDE